MGLEPALVWEQQAATPVSWKGKYLVPFLVSEWPLVCLVERWVDVEGPCSTLFLFCGHFLCSVEYIIIWLPAGLVFLVYCFHFFTPRNLGNVFEVSLYLGTGCTALGGCC